MLVSPRYMDGLYELIFYLTATRPEVEALPETMAACRRYLFLRFPDLEHVETPEIEFGTWRPWLTEQTYLYGEYLQVEKPLEGEIEAT